MANKQLQTGDKLYGFTVTRIRDSAELNGKMVEMVFDKTGTRLCWIDNGEENKLFSITFKTLPENSTGVFHILEHSTLCGSTKYPVREPFVELLKSSMNTFLNAMTFQDKTMYPVSSRVDKDYLNLAGVYLDAVFSPRLLTDERIFMQEGWHVEEDENGALIYKGVVFNEMKGAMSGADRVIGEKIGKMLYPDNSYGFNSGGDPEQIPTLTYDAFRDTYRRFYHPSNAYVFLDGDIPLDETLAMLEDYLKDYDKNEALPQVTPQVPKACRDTVTFEIGEEESITDKGRLCLGKLIGTWDQTHLLAAASVLCDVLCGSNESPLKRAVLESGLAQDMSLSIDSEVFQPNIQMDLINIKDGCEEELLTLIHKTLHELLEKGLDHEAIEASVNRIEFRIREPEEPAGLIRCISAFSGWLHGGDPLQFCTYDGDFVAIREMIRSGEIDRIAEELFLNENGLCILTGVPSKTVGTEKRDAEIAKLAALREGLSAEQLEANRAAVKALTEWQQTPDAPEALAALPTLNLSDVSPDPMPLITEVGEQAGVKTLFHPVNCHGIRHINLFFRLTDLSGEELGLLSKLCTLFGKLPTQRLDAVKLEQAIKNDLGRFYLSVSTNSRLHDRMACTPVLRVCASVLDEKLPSALSLIHEILTTTRFDSSTDRIREFVMQIDEMNKQAGVQSGHVFGFTAAASRYSAASAVSEYTNGSTSLKQWHELAGHFDEQLPSLLALLDRVVKETLCRARLTATISSDTNCDISALLNMLPEGTPIPDKAAYTVSLPFPLGLRIPAQISFAEKVWNMEEAGINFDGSMMVGANILSLACLWNRIRVQGGAYGCGLQVTQGGLLISYSYRDPTPARTIGVYNEMSDFLRAFAASGESIEKFIISTVSGTDPLASPREIGDMADSAFFNGITEEMRKENRLRMLNTVPDDLNRLAGVLDDYAAKGTVCVVGHGDALKECGDLEIRDL